MTATTTMPMMISTGMPNVSPAPALNAPLESASRFASNLDFVGLRAPQLGHAFARLATW